MQKEARRYQRFISKKDTMVALLRPPDDSENNLVGLLLDVSQSGLAFKYLPFKSMDSPVNYKQKCVAFLLQSSASKQPIASKVVYDMDIQEESCFLPPPKRIGL